MGDMGDMFNDLKAHRRHMRAEHGIKCPTCIVRYPKANPTILLPKQRCRVCGYKDEREYIDD